METFLNWLVKSSENPEKVSMTLRGILVSNIGILLFLANNYFGLDLTEEMILYTIGNLSIALGLILSLLGLIRKLYYAFK